VVQRVAIRILLSVIGLVALGTVSAAAQNPAPASAGDFYNRQYEFRIGAFAHGVGSAEEGSADVNAELVFPKLWHLPAQWDWLVPRPHVGVSVNTAEMTDYAYAGALWTYDFTRQFFGELFAGGAVHNGSITNDPDRSNLGSRALFHVGVSLGYRLTPNWSVLGTFEHLSNGNAVLHAAPSNQGLNEYGLRLGFSF
jgi:lipid A 3-O-deacylase